MKSLKKILILGSGQAAIYAASEIRKHDKDSSVTIFGNENYHPYERPPLSKEYLIDKKKENHIIKDFKKNTKSEVIAVSTFNKTSVSKIKSKLLDYVS